MKIVVAALSVGALFGLGFLLGIFDAGRFAMSYVLPYVALLLFAGGAIYRVLHWAASPVPFRIPTTSGQQKSLPWIKASSIENPSTGLGVAVRVALEFFFFRSLLRNTKTEPSTGASKIVFASAIGLWFFALLFHGCLFVIFVRHLRFFTDPIPSPIVALSQLDGVFQITMPSFFMTGGLFIVGGLYLAGRRIVDGRVRYLSFASDYFFIFLLLAVGISGVWLRYIARTDLVAVKTLTMGIVSLAPNTPENISALFFGHFFLVMCLFAMFPWSKLVHGLGLLFSPTRNQRSNSREIRHINPWNDPSIKPRSYEEYENEFRDKMKAAHIPLEKE
jgi:nitrate reductase gamma subunit